MFLSFSPIQFYRSARIPTDAGIHPHSAYCQQRDWFPFSLPQKRRGGSIFLEWWNASLLAHNWVRPGSWKRNRICGTIDDINGLNNYINLIFVHTDCTLCRASNGQQYPLPCRAHLRFPKCVRQGRGYRWPLLALGRLIPSILIHQPMIAPKVIVRTKARIYHFEKEITPIPKLHKEKTRSYRHKFVSIGWYYLSRQYWVIEF